MKKTFMLMGLLFATAFSAVAEQRKIIMDFNRISKSEKHQRTNRAPLHIPISVVYDSDTNRILISGSETINAEVLLYDATGTLENYSSSLNTFFILSTEDTYVIRIQGEEWYAEGVVEI